MTTTALITRPDEDAEPLAAALGQRGIEVVREPLLAVRPLPGASVDLAGVQALVFTSANGVRAFASLSSRRDLPAFAVGDATARAAREAGFARTESAGGAVEDLASLVERRLDAKRGALLHAAGSAVAGDLAGRLGKAGFELRRAVVYETETATQLSEEAREKLAAGEIGLVLLFSPRTAETFVRLARAAGPAVAAGLGKAIALALSPAVARSAEALKWRDLRTADRPELAAMLALVDRAAEELGPMVVAPAGVPPSGAKRATGGADRPGKDTILDVTPEPVPNPAEIEAALKRMAPKRRSGGMLVVLLLLAALAAAGYFTQDFWGPYLERALGQARQLADSGEAETTGAPAPAIEAGAAPTTSGAEGSESRFTALEAEIAALEDSVAALEESLGRVQADDWRAAHAGLEQSLGEMRDKLGALEATVKALNQSSTEADEVAALREQLDNQASQIKALERQLATAIMPNRTGDTNAGEAAADAAAATAELGHAVDALREENAALAAALEAARAKLAELTPLAGRVAALESEAGANAAESGNAALLLAVARLGSALNGARPFAPELKTLDNLAAADPALEAAIDGALAPIAARAELGIATLADLRQAFPDLARKLAQAGTGEELADAAGAEETGWFKRFLASLADLVTVRPTGADATGDSTGARIARAEAALEQGDLTAAAAELDGLPAAADWVAAARARAAAGSALEALEALALARLGQPAGDSGG